MALEWPDFEAEQKKKTKARRQSKKGGFIVKDSDSDSDDLGPRKKRKECEFSSALSIVVVSTDMRMSSAGLLFQVDVCTF